MFPAHFFKQCLEMLVLSVDLDSCNLVAIELHLIKKTNHQTNEQTKEPRKPQNLVEYKKLNSTSR